jgi:hypothetical protein
MVQSFDLVECGSIPFVIVQQNFSRVEQTLRADATPAAHS